METFFLEKGTDALQKTEMHLFPCEWHHEEGEPSRNTDAAPQEISQKIKTWLSQGLPARQ